MSKILVVASTAKEIGPILEDFNIATPQAPTGFLAKSPLIDFLISGVGQLQTGVQLESALARNNYRHVVNLGIAGSFRATLAKLCIVHVVCEVLGDLGAQTQEDDIDLFEMKLLERNVTPFKNGELQNPSIANLSALADVPKVKSVTVNQVLGREDTIQRMVKRYDPDVANMEGGAVFYTCLLRGVPFISLRSISNTVQVRDTSTWDIPGAIAALNEKGRALINELLS